MNRKMGCGLWIVWLVGALFAAEWLGLWLVLHAVPQEQLLPATLGVIIATLGGGSLAVYFRVQRRVR